MMKKEDERGVKDGKEGESATKRKQREARMGERVGGRAKEALEQCEPVRFGGRARARGPGRLQLLGVDALDETREQESERGRKRQKGAPNQTAYKDSPFLCQGTLAIPGKNPFATCTQGC